jgi:hypothetical protein
MINSSSVNDNQWSNGFWLMSSGLNSVWSILESS